MIEWFALNHPPAALEELVAYVALNVGRRRRLLLLASVTEPGLRSRRLALAHAELSRPLRG